MPLTMRPTGLSSGIYKDSVKYSVFCGEWCIGRIFLAAAAFVVRYRAKRRGTMMGFRSPQSETSSGQAPWLWVIFRR